MSETDAFWTRLQAALNLGVEAQEESATERAIRALRALLREARSDEEKGLVLLHEARFLGQLLLVTEARARLADVTRLWQKTPECEVQIAVGYALLYEMEGNPAETLRGLDRILKKYTAVWKLPDARDLYEEVQANRGRLLVGEGRLIEALPVLEETLRFEREKAGQFCYNLGYCYFKAGELEKAEQWLREALRRRLHPAIASATHYYLGRLDFDREAFARAIKEFESAAHYALQAKRGLKVIYGEMARSYNRLGMDKESSHFAELAKSAD
jgi:pentatricopeptide repeat protein